MYDTGRLLTLGKVCLTTTAYQHHLLLCLRRHLPLCLAPAALFSASPALPAPFVLTMSARAPACEKPQHTMPACQGKNVYHLPGPFIVAAGSITAWALRSEEGTFSIPRWPEVALFFWVLAICMQTEHYSKLQIQYHRCGQGYFTSLRQQMILGPGLSCQKPHTTACV